MREEEEGQRSLLADMSSLERIEQALAEGLNPHLASSVFPRPLASPTLHHRAVLLRDSLSRSEMQKGAAALGVIPRASTGALVTRSGELGQATDRSSIEQVRGQGLSPTMQGLSCAAQDRACTEDDQRREWEGMVDTEECAAYSLPCEPPRPGPALAHCDLTCRSQMTTTG